VNNVELFSHELVAGCSMCIESRKSIQLCPYNMGKNRIINNTQ